MKFFLLCIYLTFVTSTSDPKKISLAKLTVTPKNDDNRIKLPSCEVDYDSVNDPASVKMIIIFKHALSDEQSELVKDIFSHIPRTFKYELPYIYVQKTSTESRTIFQKEKLVLHMVSKQKVELKFPLGKGKKEKEFFTKKIETASQALQKEFYTFLREINTYIYRNTQLKSELIRTKRRDVVQDLQDEIEGCENTINKEKATLNEMVEEHNNIQRKIKKLHRDLRDATAERVKKEYEHEMYEKLLKYFMKPGNANEPTVNWEMNKIYRYIGEVHQDIKDYLLDDTNEIFEEFLQEGDYNSSIEVLLRILKTFYNI
jgi:hypothetical protein